MKKVSTFLKSLKCVLYAVFLNISCENPRCAMIKHIRKTRTLDGNIYNLKD